MELENIWYAYLDDHCSIAPNDKGRPIKASEAMEKFFTLHPMYTGRWEAITSCKHDEAFMKEADTALLMLARYDNFEYWDGLSAGAWRILYDRHSYCELVLGANMIDDNIIGGLPNGLSIDQETKALYLRFLLGHGRTIDWKVLQRSPDDKPEEFPAHQILRKQ